MNYFIDNVTENEYLDLIKIWNEAMLATHSFVDKEDIALLRKKTLIDLFDKCEIICARNSSNNIVGFVGVSSDTIEMLFISPMYIRHGIGKLLLQHVVIEMNAKQLYVFKENSRAVKFYEKFGFKTVEELPLDPVTGKQNRLYRMKL